MARTRITLFDALLRARAEAGGKTKILEDHDRKVLTYDDLVRAAFALGGKLKQSLRYGENPHQQAALYIPAGPATPGVAQAGYLLIGVAAVGAIWSFSCRCSVIAAAKKKGRKIGICGQAPSDYPEVATFLVEQGIDSISLNPDAVLKTTMAILDLEKS